jgi:hypothetical protein
MNLLSVNTKVSLHVIIKFSLNIKDFLQTSFYNKTMSILIFGLILFLGILVTFIEASTPISVENQFKDELNIKIQGAGVGGCDILLSNGDINNECWCLWGTINYSFCAYKNSPLGLNESNIDELKQGKCPVITGESLVCSDLSSLGNCYSGAYSCTVDSEGLCHCKTV